MINLQTIAEVKVTTANEDSKLSKILELVQNSTAQKALSELFTRKFARIYTLIVVVLAFLTRFQLYFFVDQKYFSRLAL